MPTNILLVDDDQHFCTLTEIRLGRHFEGASITVAGSLGEVREILADAESPQFDLVLLDEHLPDGNGLSLLRENAFDNMAVVTITADKAPEIAMQSLQAGSVYYLNKQQITDRLFPPLIRGIIERNRMQQELREKRTQLAEAETIKKLVSTLQHEIKNPLGVVLQAAYLIRSNDEVSEEQLEAAQLVEQSGKRINHVLDMLLGTSNSNVVQKSSTAVFHIQGDHEWEPEENGHSSEN